MQKVIVPKKKPEEPVIEQDSSSDSEDEPNKSNLVKKFAEGAKFYIPKPTEKIPKIFLPGDDEGLKEKLRLLYAEFLAGNKEATRPQIEFILQELRQRDHNKG